MSTARRVTPGLVDGDAFWRNVKHGEPSECWAHLSAGTHADNMHDMFRKRRRNARTRLSDDEIREILWLASEGIRNCDIAAGYEIDPSYVSHLKKRRHRREVTHV